MVEKNQNIQAEPLDIPQSVYPAIRKTALNAKTKVYTAVNFAMVEAYWDIGRQIACEQGERAEYGKRLLEYLSKRLTAEFGNGFTERNLQAMRQFYFAFPIPHTLCAELSWSHYRLPMKITNDARRAFYLRECAQCNWSVRQLERQINFYVRYYDEQIKAPEDNPTIGIVLCADKNDTMVKYSVLQDKDRLFASKYMTYLPTEEELKKVLEREREIIEEGLAKGKRDA